MIFLAKPDVRSANGTGGGAGGRWPVQHTGRVLLDGAVLNVLADHGDTLSLVVETPLPSGIFAVSQVGSNGFY